MDPRADRGVSQPVSGVADIPHQREILQQLERVLASPAFRGSRRSQEFLRYVVEQTVNGEAHSLKERTIAVAVFGRSPDYKTNEDAVVRVNAGEVRRRLTQYYSDAATADEIRFVVPPGHYLPDFGFPDPVRPAAGPADRPAPAGPPWKHRRMTWVTGGVLLGALALLMVLSANQKRTTDALTEFWRPALNSNRPILVGVGGNANLYSIPWQSSGEPFGVPLLADPSLRIEAKDLIPVQGQFVGAGGAQAIYRFATLFTRLGKDSFLRSGPSLDFREMKDHPSVIIGAYSSSLTWRMTQGLRFHFEDPRAGRRIVDREDGKAGWAPEIDEKGNVKVDYALVARVLRAETGQFLVIASGITGEGCVPAADFVTRPEPLARLLSHETPNWPQMNFEAVIRSRFIDSTASEPEVVRFHFWRP